MRFLSKFGTMRELASVALREHFNLDPDSVVWWYTGTNLWSDNDLTIAVWRYNDAEPMPLLSTSGGVTCAQIAAMEPLELYQTVRKNVVIELDACT